MSEQSKSEIKIEVGLDENKVPQSISWQADDAGANQEEAKAMMLSFWDKTQGNAMRMDLWTKDMLVDEMKMFYHQTLLTMADSFERSTGESLMSQDLRDFCDYFAERMQIKPQS